MTRAHLAVLLLALALPSGAAWRSEPLPLAPPQPANAAFDVGPVVLDGPARDVATEWAGSALPGISDRHARDVALGWTHRVLSGQREPWGEATWQDGVVRVRVDPRDEGAESAALATALGQRDHACLAHGPRAVTVDVASTSGAPVRLRALAYDPHHRAALPSAEAPATPGTVRLVFPPNDTCVAMLQLVVRADAPGEVVLDAVALEATTARIGLRLP